MLHGKKEDAGKEGRQDRNKNKRERDRERERERKHDVGEINVTDFV